MTSTTAQIQIPANPTQHTINIVAAGREAVQVTFHANGRCVIQDDPESDPEEVDLDAHPSEIAFLGNLIARQNDADLKSYFWENVNGLLEDPFLHETPENGDVHVSVGTLNEMQERIADVLRAEPDLFQHEDRACLEIKAACEVTEWGIVMESQIGCQDALSSAAISLVEAILEHHQPWGYEWCDTDGPMHRRSGYLEDGQIFRVSATPPSEAERGEAIERLLSMRIASMPPAEIREKIAEIIRGSP